MKKKKKVKSKKDLPAIPDELAEAFKDLTPKQAAWLVHYLDSMDGKAAALKVYNCTPGSARVIATQNLAMITKRKVLRLYMTHKGLDINYGLEKLREGMEATKTSNAAILLTKDGKTVKAEEQGVLEVPDYAERREWWDRFMGLMGVEVKKEKGVQVNTQINLDKYIVND